MFVILKNATLKDVAIGKFLSLEGSAVPSAGDDIFSSTLSKSVNNREHFLNVAILFVLKTTITSKNHYKNEPETRASWGVRPHHIHMTWHYLKVWRNH